jgi:hypothetical protein
MIGRTPAWIVHALFGSALLCATYPVWRFWVFGHQLSLDQLLQIRCF